MAVATFDTLKFSKALREAGVPEKQADAEATVLAEVFSINFKEIATKEDLKVEIAGVKVELKALEERFDYKLKDLEQRLSAKIESTVAPLRSDNILMKWMLGAILTILISVAVRMFFFTAK